MFIRFLNQKTAKQMERRLSEYGIWMDRLRRYAASQGLFLRTDKGVGCVNRRDLARIAELALPRELRHLVDWCWVIDAACRRLQEWEKDSQGTARFAGVMLGYYGLGLNAETQAEWMTQEAKARRKKVMEAEHMEQTTFYEMRREILAAVYTAGVQRGLFHPYPEDHSVRTEAV